MEIAIFGGVTLIDDEDFAVVSQYAWHVDNDGYARTHIRIGDKHPCMFLHRMVMGCSHKDGKVIDHISGDRLDNRKSNLRFVQVKQNTWNRRIMGNNTSGYKGVTYKFHKWYARISKDHVFYEMGHYQDINEAIFSYDIAAIYLFGEYCCTNLPLDNYINVDIAKEFHDRMYVPKEREYIGVYKKKYDRYEISVGYMGKSIYGGRFATAYEAAIARDAKAFELLASKAKLNFPERVVDGVYNKEVMKCGI